ncbi:glycoside hydrolase family 95 protein [Sphingobacterium sp. BIGb0165]|uniref:glycoside hydrolase family 95 protein n=1 Tax=Sphingobacterium sp. BIGb0165 TaxID=2940615 RepID=UPI002168748F|nr:glycoside hydrolase family 95 protein [Sphingobacterium sp. BIGb0165]MCS4229044.1 alpha-L-fucosidase 2 [Sphingobacterium sp. BIGb0165]
MNIKINAFVIVLLLGLSQSRGQQNSKATVIAASQRQQKIDQFWADRAHINKEGTVSVAPLKLTYTRPAKVWEEALPLGNGQLGAMIFGGIADERIQFNESTLWAGEPQNPNNPNGKTNLPQIQQLLFAGKNKEAVELADSTLMGIPNRIQPYQSLGELCLDMPHLQVDRYQRSLDLETAIQQTSYQSNKIKYTRESFISAPANLMVIRYTADKKQSLDLNFTWRRAQDFHCISDPNDASQLILQGQIGQSSNINPKGTKFAAIAKVFLKGGKLINSGGRVTITGADEITILITAATDYPGLKQISYPQQGRMIDPRANCNKVIHALGKLDYDQLKHAHIADYQGYFNRVQLKLTDPQEKQWQTIPTDSLLRLTKGKQKIPTTLISKYFQFGRYLLISSSRPGHMPANLQGLWAWQMNPPWNADFHTNINLQMNYWPAELTNLSELHQPLFDLTSALIPFGERTANTVYGARGWVVHHLTDAWGYTAPADGVWGIWPMGGAWLAQHPWEHYSYTGNRQFLKNQAYPIMKGAATFILDFMVQIPAGKPFAGYWTTNPSHSPENSFILPSGEVSSFTYGATMDTQIIRDLLQNCVEAATVLDCDPDFRLQCQAALQKLIPTQISKETGRIMEWIEDYKETEVNHRHTSHLFGLHPSNQISVTSTPDLAEAAKKTLLSRGDHSTGWSLAWRINMWNRLHDGEHAYKLLYNLISDKTLPNLFDNHPPFQIDGNFGATAAIGEMLLQSQVRDSNNNYLIELLPALSKHMDGGSITGLKARGNISVNIDWEKGKLEKAELIPGKTGPITISYAGKQIQVEGTQGKSIQITPNMF